MLENIIQHFSTLDQRPIERLAFLVGGLLIFWIIEGAIPLFQNQYKIQYYGYYDENFPNEAF